jgi:NAD(P)-dependent dehydrogenase (short-subunit alcohol dehydrogenase family)
MGKLDGKVAFITGAARGQGRSHAVLLAEEGADIIGVDICADIATCNYPLGTEEDLQETALMVEKTGRRMLSCKADVRSKSELRKALDDGVERFGRLDVVVANAGISNYQQRPYEHSDQAWQDTIDVCLTGVWNTLQVTVPTLIEGNRGGAVVITVSTAGTRVSTTNFDGGFDAYTAAKTGLVGLMRSYAGRLGRHNIRVQHHPSHHDRDSLGAGRPLHRLVNGRNRDNGHGVQPRAADHERRSHRYQPGNPLSGLGRRPLRYRTDLARRRRELDRRLGRGCWRRPRWRTSVDPCRPSGMSSRRFPRPRAVADPGTR